MSLDELGISLINIRSTGFENIAKVFHNDRIRRNCSIITDLDAAIDEEGKGAEKIGKLRKTRIDEFCKENDWVESFYAEHTFEIDFITAGNSHEAKKTIKEVYTDPITIKKAKEELDSDDVKVYGKRILTMANHEGKGWFAILLGKSVEPNTYIPTYIIDALVFAVQNLEEHLLDIIAFRVGYLKANDKKGIDFASVESLITLCQSGKERLDTLKKEIILKFPEDDITDLLKRV